MAATKQLAAVTRSGTGKGAARHVRREARVPGVIYGGGEKPEPISVDFKDLNKHIYAGHFLTTIFELEIEGRKERVLPRDYQLDVVTDRPLHVDFLRLRPGSRVRTSIPLHVVNRDTAPGVKRGGTVNIVNHSLELLVPADDIPDAVEVDIGALDFHDAVHISDLKLPAGCRSTDKPTATVVTIVPPTVLPEEPAAAAAAAAPAAAPAKGGKAAPAAAAAAPAKGAAPAAKGAAPAAKPAAKK
jgi:large subunit ribosomal protein L25